MNRARMLSLVLLPLLLLTGCGIQKSDVVEAGGPATVTVHPTGDVRMLLFFVGPNGRLMPVSRDFGLAVGPDGESSVIDSAGRVIRPTHPAGGGYRIAPAKVLATLLEGPETDERDAGLTTRLDLHGAGRPHVESEPAADGGSLLRLSLATRVHDLDPLAHQQLVCTTAFAEGLGNATPVLVSGTDDTLPPTRCEEDAP